MNISPPKRRADHRIRGAAWRCMPVVMGLLGLLALAFAGCQDEIKRYETLSFFFDGVPVPEGYERPDEPEPLIGPWGVLIDSESELGQQMLANKQAQPALPDLAEPEEVFFYHTPYKNRDCFGCHDQSQGYTPPATGAELCNKCHESYTQYEADDWVHGPVVIGQCGWCHEAHKSKQPTMTKDTQPSLCMTCHDQAFIEHDEFHVQLEDPNCTDCHDPHASGNRLLLADARTYQRRAKSMALLPSPHAGWSKDLCSNCHIPEQSNMLREDADATCLTCHDLVNEAQTRGVELHEAVSEGKCTTCHTAHRSAMPKLIRTNAEQKCFACHKLEQVRTANHPDVTRVDCLLCHSGHHSNRPSLLKTGIPIPTSPARASGGEP